MDAIETVFVLQITKNNSVYSIVWINSSLGTQGNCQISFDIISFQTMIKVTIVVQQHRDS